MIRRTRAYRGSGPIGRLPLMTDKPRWRIGPSKPFVAHRMPYDVIVKLWRTKKLPYAALPHPTKSGPGRT